MRRSVRGWVRVVVAATVAMVAVVGLATGAWAAPPVATDFDLNDVPVNTVLTVAATDLVSSFADDPDPPVDATDLTFDSATIDTVPVASPAVAGFSYTPGAGPAGAFTVDPTVAAFSGLTPGSSADVEVSFTVTNTDGSDTGVLRYTVVGDLGPYDEVTFDDQGTDVPASGITTAVTAGVAETLVSVVFTGGDTTQVVLAGYDFAAIVAPPPTPDTETAVAIAGNDSTATATAQDSSASTADALDESTATAFTARGSAGSAVASEISDATASAIDGSIADATATMTSSAVADAANASEAEATADDESTAVASADFTSNATAFAGDSSVSGADALNDSTADAVALDNSAASASASNTADATAVGQLGSSAEANADATSSASAAAETGSTATADAFNGSTTTSQATDDSSASGFASDTSVANSEASGTSITDAVAVGASAASAIARDGSGALALGEQGSSADAEAEDGSSANAGGDEGSIAQAQAAFDATSLARAGTGSSSEALACRDRVVLASGADASINSAQAPASVELPEIDDDAPNSLAVRMTEALATSADTTTRLPFEIIGSGATIGRVQIGGFPEGTVLSAGTEDAPGLWSFAELPPENLSFVLPPGWTGTFALDILVEPDGTGTPERAAGATTVVTVGGNTALQPTTGHIVDTTVTVGIAELADQAQQAINDATSTSVSSADGATQPADPGEVGSLVVECAPPQPPTVLPNTALPGSPRPVVLEPTFTG